MGKSPPAFVRRQKLEILEVIGSRESRGGEVHPCKRFEICDSSASRPPGLDVFGIGQQARSLFHARC